MGRRRACSLLRDYVSISNHTFPTKGVIRGPAVAPVACSRLVIPRHVCSRSILSGEQGRNLLDRSECMGRRRGDRGAFMLDGSLQKRGPVTKITTLRVSPLAADYIEHDRISISAGDGMYLRLHRVRRADL